MIADPFATRNWAPVVKSAPAATAPPPAPSAPPLPFAFLGKQRIESGWEVFLSRGDQTLILREGAVIDGDTYRVESINPPTLVLNYLPLAQQQTIAIGGDE